jgi:Domain of unknown function (DUF4124)
MHQKCWLSLASIRPGLVIRTIIWATPIAAANIMPLIKPTILALLLCLSNGVYAEVYSWIDEDGNRVYTDKKPSTKGPSAQKPLPAPQPVNYYSQPKSTVSPGKAKSEAPSLANIEAISETDESEVKNKPLTEQECKKQYQMSCDQVVNWRQYAQEKCGDDARCQDEGFLDRKYRPRTLQEQQAIARRAGVRNNMRDKKIAQFLTKEYTDYCANQAELYCKNKSRGQCEKVMEGFCADSRNLHDIFNRYSSLTVAEKQQIVKKAKQLAAANGKNTLDYKKLLADVINLLIMQSTLGI